MTNKMVSSPILANVRYGAYASLFLWTVLLIILCIVRLNYTSTRRTEKSLNDGNPFYDPSVAELLFTSLVTVIWVPCLLICVRRKAEHVFLTRVWLETAMLGFMWIFWLSGAAAASTVWPNLSFCIQFWQCRELQALMAFAWLGWISLTVLAIATVFLCVTTSSLPNWEAHVHVEWAGWTSGERMAGAQSPKHESISAPEMYSFTRPGARLSDFVFPRRGTDVEALEGQPSDVAASSGTGVAGPTAGA